MKPKIDIRTGYIQGYGGPSLWSVRVIHENILLDGRDRLSSEFEQGVAVAELKAQWDREWNDADWLAAIQGKPLASPLCDHCGKDTLDGTISCVDKVFCRKCEPFIEEYKARYREEQQAFREQLDARQAQQEAARAAENAAQLKGAFHWRDNWYFKRRADGSVNVMRLQDGKYLIPDLVIPENEWESIVVHLNDGRE